MLLILALILLVIWAVGFLLFHLGSLIHIVLIAAIVLFIWHWMAGRSTAK